MARAERADHAVLEEERAWESVVADVLGADAELLAVSRWIGDSRAYAKGRRVALIRSRHTPRIPGLAPLREEADFLERLGRRVDYVELEDWDVLLVDRIPGTTYENLLPGLSLVDRARFLLRIARKLHALHKRQIGHRDLRPDNIMVDPEGRTELIDFDRATTGGQLSVALADWVGFSPRGLSANPFWKLVLFTFAPKAYSIGRRVRALVTARRALPRTHATGSEQNLLARAWSIAQRSGSNAPGQDLAYYALTYQHQHFPGERPWYLRWEYVRKHVALEGARVLELGSNLGLFASFAMIHGAREAIAVDRDAEILQAGRLVAQALGVDVSFRCIDLARGSAWEHELPQADIVFALSLLHWLPDPERVLRFLARHREVVYEGHDPLDVENARLASAGFEQVAIVMETERGRFVLHGRKGSP